MLALLPACGSADTRTCSLELPAPLETPLAEVWAELPVGEPEAASSLEGYDLAAGGLDRDGLRELVHAADGAVRVDCGGDWGLSDRDAAVILRDELSGWQGGGALIGDFGGDGADDVLVLGEAAWGEPEDRRLRVYRGSRREGCGCGSPVGPAPSVTMLALLALRRCAPLLLLAACSDQDLVAFEKIPSGPENQPPVATITAPPEGDVPVVLSGLVSDPEDAPPQLRAWWSSSEDGAVACVVPDPDGVVVATVVRSEGDHVIELWARDTAGATAVDTVLLSVRESGDTGTDPTDPGPCHVHDRYILCTEGLYWAEAQADCEGMGASLATLGDSAENTWVAGLTALYEDEIGWVDGYPNWWSGLNDRDAEGTWTWSSGEPLGWTSWHPSQPDNCPCGPHGDDEDCVHLNWGGQGLWNDSGCVRDPHPYVCELPEG